MLEKLLRFPLPDQLKAVAEKIDSLDETSSDGRISSWVRGSSALSKYERWVLKRAFSKRDRARTLCEAMTLVITPEPTHGEYLTGQINFMTEEWNVYDRKDRAQIQSKRLVVKRQA
jgi:hypothetical protein